MTFSNDRKYTKDHEWILKENNDLYVVGITLHAAESLGDVVFVELPAVGEGFAQSDKFGEIESVKAVSDLFLPIAGEIVEVNQALTDDPSSVNKDPQNEGWLVKIKPTEPVQIDDLMSGDEYTEFTQ